MGEINRWVYSWAVGKPGSEHYVQLLPPRSRARHLSSDSASAPYKTRQGTGTPGYRGIILPPKVKDLCPSHVPAVVQWGLEDEGEGHSPLDHADSLGFISKSPSASVTAYTGATGTEVDGDKNGKMKHNIGKAVALMN